MRALIVALAAALMLAACGSDDDGGGSGGGAGSSSAGAWKCADYGGTSCMCNKAMTAGEASCPATYNCCFTKGSGDLQLCSCSNQTADCATYAGQQSGTVVTACPPP